jgi:hypothetical protein
MQEKNVDGERTQAMILGKSQYSYDLKVDNQIISKPKIL